MRLGGGRARSASLAAFAGLAASACGDKPSPPSAGSEPPPWATEAPAARPRPGMVWIPKGTLVAGTPPARVPRVPDAELPGVPIELEGFYIDVYPHPNEAGAIPTTAVTRDEAAALCEKEEKRLCTELEIERACKGEENHAYPYGDAYRHDVCGTGKTGNSLTPNGLHAGCVSPFGVHDTHGTVWFWTASDFDRGTKAMVVLKGGNSQHGELVGRCAHVRPEKPTAAAPNLGVRCCAGPVNAAKVALEVTRGTPLRYRSDDKATQEKFEIEIRKLADVVEGKAGEPVASPGASAAAFDVERIWVWHPLGNEELLLAGGCAAASGTKKCGVFAGREIDGEVKLIVFVSSDRWQPTVGESDEARVLHVMGGDDYGAFRKTIAWEWGKVTIFAKERKKGRRWVAP